MNFASDNTVGASAPIIDMVAEAARAGAEGTYGGDRWSLEAAAALERLFEHKLDVVLVPTGTAANALALAAVTPPWGGVMCHATSHIIDDECGAPEFFTAGAKLVGIPGLDGKITAGALAETLRRFPPGVVRQVQAASLSLSQATECGTVYRPDEIAELTAVAREAGLAVHMDGARFANALVELGCSPADMTWKAGVDIVSFGATKNGALACEAVIFFQPAHAAHAAIQRKRAGHTLSKGRLLGAQMSAYLRDDHWLDLARHANAMAARLAGGLDALALRLPWPREANEVFVMLPRAVDAALQAAGAHYYPWEDGTLAPERRARPDEVFVRLICSFETQPGDVDALLAAIRRARSAT